jgi:SAM-dependent methyltransferase
MVVPLDPLLLDALHVLLRTHLPLVPDWISLAQLTEVLDVGCGLQNWGRDLYHLMIEQAGEALVTDVHIVGIEQDEVLMRRALLQTRSSRGNVMTQQADVYQLPASFTERFDLVHVRFLSPWVTPADWPALLEVVSRVCKPGGWVLWTEPTLPTIRAQTPAWNQWLIWLEQVLVFSGGGIIHQEQMERAFAQAGPWLRVEQHTRHLPLSTFSRLPSMLTDDEVQRLREWLRLLLPCLHAANIATPAMLTKGLEQVVNELRTRQVESLWAWHVISRQKESGIEKE